MNSQDVTVRYSDKDLAEFKAIQKIFCNKIPALTTNKLQVGHSLGASGMLSIEMAILMLNHQKFIDIPWLVKTVQIIILVFLIIILQFFRNPKRTTILNNDTIVAPVDGKVVVIEEVEEPEYFKDKRLQVSIFMSPINVHVTRYAMNGIIKYSKYHPGKYLVAWHPKSSTKNERTTVVVEHAQGEQILFRQIAGFLARRIKFYLREGEQVQQGQECGFIKFGSRVDVFLPPGAHLKVKVGEKVKGGASVLAAL